MKTKTHARVLSWILSICMIAALIPAIPAVTAQAADGDTVVYNFANLVENSSLTQDLVPKRSNIADTDILEKYDTEDEVYEINKTEGKWSLSNAGTTYTNAEKQQDGTFVRIRNNDFYIKATGTASGYIEYKINVETEGWYKIQSDMYCMSSVPFLSIAIGEESIDKTLLIGDTFSSEELGTYYLTKGVHTVRYSVTGTKTTQFFVRNLTMTEIVPEIEITGGLPTAIYVGESAALPTVGNTVTVGDETFDASVSFESSAPDAISIEDGNAVAKSAGFSEITMTATYDTDEKITKTYYIFAHDAKVAGTYVYYMTGQAADKSNTNYLNALLNTTYSTASEDWAPVDASGNTYLRNDQGIGMLLGSGKSGYVNLTVKAPAEGWYVLSASVYEAGNSTAQYALKDSEGAVIASCTDIEAGQNDAVKPGNAVYLKANTEYTFYFYAERGSDSSSANDRNYLRHFKLEEITSGIFGSKYAYVQKNGKTYTLYFVGGLNDIAYAKAGFEIVGTNEVAETNEVYDYLSVNGTSYEASAYGAEYIFCAEKADLAAGSIITIKPYVEKADGTRIYHGEEGAEVTFTITLPGASE